MHTLSLSSFPVLCQFKLIAQVCTLNMVKYGPSAYFHLPTACLSHVINLLTWPFTMPFYFSFRGKWIPPDLWNPKSLSLKFLVSSTVSASRQLGPSGSALLPRDRTERTACQGTAHK
jgi:hypothetical protein